MSRRRRLRIEAPEGAVVVRDISLPGARLVEIELPDGRRARLAEHLCGWTCTDDPAREAALWPTVGDAVAAFAGTTGDGVEWIAVLEEYATRLGAGSSALPSVLEGRLQALRAGCPGLYWDGPRAADGGGWYVLVGGLPGGTWVMETADTAEAAAERAVAQAEETALGDAT